MRSRGYGHKHNFLSEVEHTSAFNVEFTPRAAKELKRLTKNRHGVFSKRSASLRTTLARPGRVVGTRVLATESRLDRIVRDAKWKPPLSLSRCAGARHGRSLKPSLHAP